MENGSLGLFVPVMLLLIIVIVIQQRNKTVTVARIIKRKRIRKGGRNQMKELAKRFLDKECIIYTLNYQLEGTVKEVSNGAILVDKKGTLEAVNLDFITRIREFPRDKKGKKKSVVLD